MSVRIFSIHNVITVIQHTASQDLLAFIKFFFMLQCGVLRAKYCRQNLHALHFFHIGVYWISSLYKWCKWCKYFFCSTCKHLYGLSWSYMLFFKYRDECLIFVSQVSTSYINHNLLYSLVGDIPVSVVLQWYFFA